VKTLAKRLVFLHQEGASKEAPSFADQYDSGTVTI